jgi:hypothetical protein
MTLTTTLLRKELEPQLDVAEQRYPEVYAAIMAYTAFCDAHGDEDNTKNNKLRDKLQKLTGKDLSDVNLEEWWEEDGAENLAFAISLPSPQKVADITLSELTELVQRAQGLAKPACAATGFQATYYDTVVFSIRYFHQLLALNFKAYSHKLFQRNQDSQGKYFEYSTAEIVAKLLDKKV